MGLMGTFPLRSFAFWNMKRYDMMRYVAIEIYYTNSSSPYTFMVNITGPLFVRIFELMMVSYSVVPSLRRFHSPNPRTSPVTSSWL